MSETMSGASGPSRLDRRKARTRGALIAAAREMLASRDPAEVSIQEITEAADVGFGSFYNHFDSKAELFDAALTEAIEELGQLLDDVTRDIDDPAQVFATAVRITARLPRTHPQLAKIMLRTGLPYLTTEQALTPRALRDLRQAKRAGRFAIDDPHIALACTGGALLGVLQLASTQARPSHIDRAADELAVNLLRMFGVPHDEARAIASAKLPSIGQPAEPA
jgi:AcrR family transcriptional regulator